MTFPGLVRANNLNDVVDRERAWDNLGANISANIPIPSPSLDLNFASNKSLVDNVSGQNLITFTRPSTGTFVGSNGFIQTAASNVPRFDHNPATGESLGLLVEAAKTNSMWPSIISASHWTYISMTPTYNATTAPDGTNTATLLKPNAGLSSFRAVRHGLAHPSGPGMISFYAKSNGLGWVGIGSGNGDPWFYSSAAYNVLTGATRTYLLGSMGYQFNSAVNVGNGWWRIFINYYGSMPGGDQSFVGVTPSANGDIVNPSTANGVDGMYVWGLQYELETYATSYIPTVASTVTRAADVAQITGTNLSSFYNAGRGTIYAEQFKQAGTGGVAIGDTASNRLLDWQSSRIYRTSWGGVNYTWTGAPAVSATSLNRAALAYGQTVQGSVNGSSYVLSPFIATASFPTTSLAFQGAFSRIVFWGDQLPSSAIAAITSISNVQIGALPSSYATNATTLGKDIAALNAVRNASTRDFVFIKGLLSAAQPRLTTAAALASSGTASQNASLLKASPTTAGNFFINRGGIVASGLRVNNTNIASLSSSAFSGSTALFPIVVSSLKLSSGLRWAPAMTSGTVTFPDRAIPIETSEFILFAKAGQS